MRLRASLLLALACVGGASAQTPSPGSAPADPIPFTLPSLPKLPTVMVSPSDHNTRAVDPSTTPLPHPATAPSGLVVNGQVTNGHVTPSANGQTSNVPVQNGQPVNGQLVNGQVVTTPVIGAPPQPMPVLPPPRAEHLLEFDPQKANVVWENQNWHLVAGEVTLKDFGRSEAEARQALRVVRELNLTEHGSLDGGVEYWLSKGHAPSEWTATGLRYVPMDRGTVKADNMHGQWVLRDQQRVLFNFGPAGAESARQALAVVEKYGFTRIGLIGGLKPSMLVFFGPAPGEIAPARAAAAPSLSPAAPTTPPPPPPPGSPAARILEHNPGADATVPVVAAIPPLRGNSGVLGSVVEQNAGDVTSVKFDWRQVTTRHDPDGWKVAAGRTEFANLGQSAYDAQRALQAFQHYHFTEVVRYGSPSDGAGYYLVNGVAPHGTLFGVPTESFRPADVTLRQVGDHYAVYAGERQLARCGTNPDSARQLADAIRQHGFDHLCHLGNAEAPGLSFFVRSH